MKTPPPGGRGPGLFFFRHGHGGDHGFPLPVQKDCESTGITVLVVQVVDTGLCVYPDLKAADNALAIGLDESFCHIISSRFP